MSEELGSAIGRRHGLSPAPATPGTDAAQPSNAQSNKRPRTTQPKNVPGGGSALASGDKPGDPFATLFIVATDGCLGKLPSGGGLSATSLKSDPGLRTLDTAISRALELVSQASRSVLVVTGDTLASNFLMMETVRRMEGGLDAFGPGKRCEALLKERSAPWGALWESCLLIKALAKRQVSTIRFGAVVVLTSSCMAEPTRRVYEHCFSDWRVLVDGGAAKGGRDDPMDVRVESLPTGDADEGTADTGDAAIDEALVQRSVKYDDAWFAKGLETHCHHPSWPKQGLQSA